jgi:hypothetical protein
MGHIDPEVRLPLVPLSDKSLAIVDQTLRQQGLLR